MDSHKNVNWNFIFNEEKEIESKIDTKWQFAKWEKRQGESRVIEQMKEKRKEEELIKKKHNLKETHGKKRLTVG